MNILLWSVGLIAGFFLLIKGADVFVAASVNIANRLKVPNIIIGLTIVALGTSAPEAVISVSAAFAGDVDMAVGNVIGSNVFNLLFIIGVCAIVRPMLVDKASITKDFWISIAAALLLLLMNLVFTDTIPRLMSVILLVLFAGYIYILIRQAMKHRDPEIHEEENHHLPLPRNILFVLLGIAVIVIGGQLVVNSAVFFAELFGVSPRIIGLTILAIGTSLPELVVSLVACKKGNNDVALGNVIGSNIFNILFVLGLAGSTAPLPIQSEGLTDILFLIAGSLVFFGFAISGKKITRLEGLGLVGLYAAYMVFTLIF